MEQVVLDADSQLASSLQAQPAASDTDLETKSRSLQADEDRLPGAFGSD